MSDDNDRPYLSPRAPRTVIDLKRLFAEIYFALGDMFTEYERRIRAEQQTVAGLQRYVARLKRQRHRPSKPTVKTAKRKAAKHK
jgi:hypothetical protein